MTHKDLVKKTQLAPRTVRYALKKLKEQRFDLVITDLNMPVMDGLKLIKRIRSEETTRELPIIVITTEGGLEDRKVAINLGANSYITKPIRAPQVVDTVKALLEL